MRIAQVIPDLGIGGAEVMLATLADGLAKRRHDVSVLVLGPRLGNHVEASLEAAVPVRYLDKPLGFRPAYVAAVASWLRAQRPDVVHTHRAVLRYASAHVLTSRRPYVHTVHNLAHREAIRADRPVQALLFRSGVRAIACSPVVARSVHDLYGLRPPVIDNGVRSAAVERRPSQKPSLISVGRLSPQKRHDRLLDAFALIAPKWPRADLQIVGEGAERPRLEEQVRSLGLQGRVTLPGTRSSVAEVLATADAFVLSSDWEGSPLAVLEALSAGVPVVATAVGGLPAVLDGGTCGVLVEPHVSQLADGLDALLRDPGRMAALADAGRRRFVERYSADAMVKAYEAMYVDVVSGRASRYVCPPAD